MAPARWLNLELKDSTGSPLSFRSYVLTLPDGSRREGSLDHEGYLHEEIPPGVEGASLLVAERRFELDMSALPEADTVEGVQERLNHLNYFVGRTDGELGRFTRMAVERFQRDHGLEVTGRVDAATAERLRQEHGA
ncbi:MAG: peptidoglycan-binding protein [Myxococcales bacterium]|nr:peptidoglycan-binding protein [Myxococcales bacterium]MCB9715190.1 peptidoglycan-binding protein [Myxococcales bacterium]